MARPVKEKATPMDKMMTLAVVIIILIVAGLAVFATYGKIAANVEEKAIAEETKKIQSGETEPTLRYLASQAGIPVDEYLEKYGLSLGGDISKTSTQTELTDMMTVENRYKFIDESNGAEEATDVEKLLTDWGAADYGVTKDTVWGEAQTKIPFKKYVGEDFEEMVEQYKNAGYDLSSITDEMSLKEATDKLEEIINAGPTLDVPTPLPEEEEAEAAPTEAPAEKTAE